MRRILGLIASLSVLSAPCVMAAARMSSATPGPSASQMVQCYSPDPQKAIIGCTAIVQASGTPELKAAAYSARGLAYQKRGENDRAISDLDSAIRIAPK